MSRCRICGRIHIGNHPTRCPYCGAYGKYIVPVSKWVDENVGVKPNSEEIQNLKTTRDLEYTNTRFYFAAAKATKNAELHGFFTYLAYVENEHYNIAVHLLREICDPSIFDPSEEKGDDLKNLEHSKKKEEHATALYLGFAEKTTNERLRTFFSALSEVESDHVYLDDEEISNKTA
jgi:rubrerythrin